MSAQQISQYLTAELTARARVESAKAQLDAQLLRLKHTQLLAPDSGIITQRSGTVGSVVGAGTELFRLIRQHRLECRADVPAAELARVLKPGGILLVKCQDYVSSGKIWWGTDYTRHHIATMYPKTIFVDRLYFLNNGSAQPPRTRADGQPSVQQHARVNVSTLWVFRKGPR